MNAKLKARNNAAAGRPMAQKQKQKQKQKHNASFSGMGPGPKQKQKHKHNASFSGMGQGPKQKQKQKQKHLAVANAFGPSAKKKKNNKKNNKSKQKAGYKYVNQTVTDTVSVTGETVTETEVDPVPVVINERLDQNVNMTSPFSSSTGTFTQGTTGEGGLSDEVQKITQVVWKNLYDTQSSEVDAGSSKSTTSAPVPGKAKTIKRTKHKHNLKKKNFNVILHKKATKKISTIILHCKIRPQTNYTAWSHIQQLTDNPNREATSYEITRATDGSFALSTIYWDYDPTTHVSTKTDAAVLIMSVATNTAIAESIASNVLNTGNVDLTTLAPRVTHVNSWALVPAALTALPPGSIFVVAGDNDTLATFAAGGSNPLTTTVINAVKAWVTAGGRYMGMGCGAYIAGPTCTHTGLALSFPGLGVAPISIGQFPNENGVAHSEDVQWPLQGDVITPCPYNGGGYIERNVSSTEKFEVQANYPAFGPDVGAGQFAHDSQIACIQYKYGSGKVLVATSMVYDPWEQFESIVVDLLSARVLLLNTLSFAPRATWTNTKRKDHWTVQAGVTNCMEVGVPKTLDTIIDSTYPSSYLSRATVPLVVDVENTNSGSLIYDVLMFLFTFHFEFNPLQTKTIKLEGVAGNDFGFKVTVVKEGANVAASTYTMEPMIAAGDAPTLYSPAKWHNATHVMKVCAGKNILTYSPIPNGWIGNPNV